MREKPVRTKPKEKTHCVRKPIIFRLGRTGMHWPRQFMATSAEVTPKGSLVTEILPKMAETFRLRIHNKLPRLAAQVATFSAPLVPPRDRSHWRCLVFIPRWSGWMSGGSGEAFSGCNWFGDLVRRLNYMPTGKISCTINTYDVCIHILIMLEILHNILNISSTLW